MQSSQTPTLIPLPFASGGGMNTIPEASQLPGNPGGASLTDGFPPATRTPIVAGGIPPSGLDMNGILYMITQSTRWSHAGGLYVFSSSFAADANVGGYPNGAELMSADLQGSWISQTDNNTDNPDTGPGTKWVPGRAYGVTAISGLTNVNVTLTPAQAAKNKITLAGTLTGNIQIILPAWTRDWTVVNNTSGPFTVTVKTAAGTGVLLAPGQQKVTGDGTNIVQPAESIAAAVLPQQPAQLQQIGHGQCRLSVVSGTQLKLAPYNGNNLIINGVPQQIPAAGVTLANTGLTASTKYYVYAYMNAGTMTLEAVTTGHTTGTNGVEQKSGDATRTLVGMLLTDSSTPGQFVDTAANRQIANWFTKRNIPAVATLTVDTNFTGGSFGKVTTSLDVTFPYWGDNDGGVASLSGSVANNTSGGQSQVAVFVDGSQFGNTASASVSGSTIQNASVTSLSLLNNGAPLTEGFHVASAYGASSTGSTSTLRASTVVVVQTRA